MFEGDIFTQNSQIAMFFQDQSGMGISNLLSCNNSSIVPPRLDPLKGSWRVLLSFSDLTFLNNIILRATRWNVCLCFHTYVFKVVAPPL